MSDQITAAILATLTYADLFDYPLTPEQLHRYLIGVRASRQEVNRALAQLNGNVARAEGWLMLPRRHALAAQRARLQIAAQHQIARARFYARILAYLPFVRMIALTGGLAMENARDHDIDWLIVTAPKRLWFVRGLAVALVRLARLRGDHLCPNFLLTENALKIPDENLYNAHEIVQMIPLYGFNVYRVMRSINAWAEIFLPNADGMATLASDKPLNRVGEFFKRATEYALGGRIGNVIEHWEMMRKIAKLCAQVPANADGVVFSPDQCRGFFSGHGRKTLDEFYKRTKTNSE